MEAAQEALEQCSIELWTAKKLDKEAGSALALAKRLFDAKIARLQKAWAGRQRGEPGKSLDRLNEAEIAYLKAQLERERAAGEVLRAKADLHAQRATVLGLGNAKLRRTLRSRQPGKKIKRNHAR